MFLANLSLVSKALLIAVAINFCKALTSDDKDYPGMLQVQDDFTFYYKAVITDSGENALSVKAVYQGLGWLGIGINPDGEMIGGEAVVGQPDAAVSSVNPGKYALSSASTSGVTLMKTQTLIDGSITQDGSTTTLAFTKLLEEYYEYIIKESGKTTFIWAIGSDNTFPAYHSNRGSFDLDLSSMPSAASASTEISGMSSVSPAPTVSISPASKIMEYGGTAMPTQRLGSSTTTMSPSHAKWIIKTPSPIINGVSGMLTLSPTPKYSSSMSPSPVANAISSNGSSAPTVSKAPASLSASTMDTNTSPTAYSGSDDYFKPAGASNTLLSTTTSVPSASSNRYTGTSPTSSPSPTVKVAENAYSGTDAQRNPVASNTLLSTATSAPSSSQLRYFGTE
jgi:hypothetical protein